DINGGGATLPQKLYQTSGVLTAGFAPYIGVGSGNGKAAFLTNDYTKLTATELSTYATNLQPTWGKLIQVPSVATSVAIPFRITDWSGISGAGRTGPITVVYRITYMSPDFAASTLAGLDDATKGVSPAPSNVSDAIAQVLPPNDPSAPLDVTNPDDGVAGVQPYPDSGYPILGFTNLIFSAFFTKAFFTKHFGDTNNNDDAITANRFVPLPDNWKTELSTYATNLQPTWGK
uniref:NAD(+) ADP-ribosyltransferase (Fragments) n=1 Tax=Saccharolobus solfataricus TaxID=2287 RepID=PARP_SACSO|nr:RecName: Full=NAD(+) ADP-ribosyltransferase; Short=PARPSss; AltName: Full=Poly(ADP-ribose) polymerase-like thermozyme [Saccharolobus solfataricus]